MLYCSTVLPVPILWPPECQEESVQKHGSWSTKVLESLKHVETTKIVYAPTFRRKPIYSLGLHGLQDKLAEMNHALKYFREAVGHQVYVAGDITTTGKMMEPAGDLTYGYGNLTVNRLKFWRCRCWSDRCGNLINIEETLLHWMLLYP